VRAQIECARSIEQPDPRPNGSDVTAIQNDDDALIAELARLAPLDYERRREAEAERLEVRVSILDKLVYAARSQCTPGKVIDDIGFPQHEAWPEPVIGMELLDEISAILHRFVVLPKHAGTAISLWILFTHLIEAAEVAPILAIVSPEKRCGKTTLLAFLSRLAYRPLTASNVSASAVFRCIESWAPTLIIDEADTFLADNEELRGVINSGHTRATAYVLRCVGDDHEARRFSTWGAKAIALIGNLPDTLMDRAIAIELRRKLPSDTVVRFRRDTDLGPLARRCMRFAVDNADRIRGLRTHPPAELNDRAADNWEVLLTIAEVVGGEWPRRAREAAISLSGASPDGDSVKIELLRDLRALLEGKGQFAGRSTVSSAELVEALLDDKASRWPEYNHGRPLNQRQLARLLRPFGIVPGTVRLRDNSTPKGYRVAAFEDSFKRYLSPLEPPHRRNPMDMRVSEDFSSATVGQPLRIDDPPQASTGADCGDVADQNGGIWTIRV